MHLTGKRPTFRKQQPRSNPYRVLVLFTVIMVGLFILRAVEAEQIEPAFQPTPTPTRASDSFMMEAETHFYAGNLDKAIEAYLKAAELEPDNAQILVQLARVQAYSSSLLSTDSQRGARLKQAMDTIDRAVELAPEDSTAHAIRAFVLDWYADPIFVGEDWQYMLGDAEQEAVFALSLDNRNTLALAFYAEVLVDQQNLIQADQYITQALERDPEIMDVHRVYGYVRESLGYYGDAITAYQRAAEITPNFTYLYIRIGVNYRQLQQFDRALEYFAKAANINEQLGINDPIPYLAIGKTYSQMGEFFIAARNVEKVLELDPINPDIYGTLGMIYFKSRNYEGAIDALRCATYGCTEEVSCRVRQCIDTDPQVAIPPTALTTTTVVYYYTYGSVLAGMHRPNNDYCREAMQVLADVRRSFSNEPTIMSIVETSEEICLSFGYTRN